MINLEINKRAGVVNKKNPPAHDKHVVQSLQTFRLYIKTFSNSIFIYMIHRTSKKKYLFKISLQIY